MRAVPRELRGPGQAAGRVRRPRGGRRMAPAHCAPPARQREPAPSLLSPQALGQPWLLANVWSGSLSCEHRQEPRKVRSAIWSEFWAAFGLRGRLPIP